MTTNNLRFMSTFALSAAALFVGACKDKPTTPPGGGNTTADEQVQCFGINTCSGESKCAVNKPELGIEHSCAGENSCKMKGWIPASRTECEAQKGEVLGTL
jgi:hypothetical protein